MINNHNNMNKTLQNIYLSNRYSYKLPDCYIYLYHTDEYFILPQYPESIQDSLESNFQSQNALSRTAPVFSYNNSGPRTIQVTLDLHRDMMNDVNKDNIRLKYNDGNNDTIYKLGPDVDYVDLLARKLQSIALPRYNASNSLVVPPMVAIRFGDQVFIKGIVNGGVTITYSGPILSNKKYARVGISFSVTEIQPYDADSVGRLGSLRGVTASLADKIKEITGRKGD